MRLALVGAMWLALVGATRLRGRRRRRSSGISRVRIPSSFRGVAWQKRTRPAPPTASVSIAGQAAIVLCCADTSPAFHAIIARYASATPRLAAAQRIEHGDFAVPVDEVDWKYRGPATARASHTAWAPATHRHRRQCGRRSRRRLPPPLRRGRASCRECRTPRQRGSARQASLASVTPEVHQPRSMPDRTSHRRSSGASHRHSRVGESRP